MLFMRKKNIILTALLWLSVHTQAQQCTAPGQTPVSAILVCGSESFHVNTPTYCGQTTIPTPCTDGFSYMNKNPNFFRMACFSPGTLGFLITPGDLMANYNWQLFDITGSNPNDVFTNSGLFVACNWSGDVGETGASSDGTSLTVCSGPQPLFSKMPDLVQGHTYMLMVVNESGSPGSYDLIFTGGTASITDAIEPHLLNAKASCNAAEIIVKLNKKVQCNSIDASGREFTLSSGAVVTAATPGFCNPTFGTDSVILSLSQPLLVGNYTLTIGNGADGNTLLDVCNRTIPVGETVSFNINPLQFTPFDSIFPPGCSPKYLELIFRKPIRCSSIAANGSDFIITGPQTISTSFAPGSCGPGGIATIIRLNLSAPIVTGGTYNVQLTTGSDGNTILDECGSPTPAGSAVSFTMKDPVSASFTYQMPPSCTINPVSFFHNGNGNTNNWRWNFGSGSSSTLQNPVNLFPTSGSHPVQLIVSNGKCSDTASQTILVGGDLTAAFGVPSVICPGDTIHFDNKSGGSIDSWKWNMGNGVTITDKTPVGHFYRDAGREIYYTITLIAANTTLNCSDTATHIIKALSNCYIAVPSAFTPNGDGKNDYLYPLNALKADQLEFKVYNRFGQLVFYTKDWTKKWDGRVNGLPQNTGVYAWFLSYTHHDTGEKVFLKGTTLLMH
jgi:gliding motility-associated-like protein